LFPLGQISVAEACARQESGKTYMIIICIFRGHRIACKKRHIRQLRCGKCLLYHMHAAEYLRSLLLPSEMVCRWSSTVRLARAEMTALTLHSRATVSYFVGRVTPLSPFHAKVRMSETAWKGPYLSHLFTTYSPRVNAHGRPLCFRSAIAIKGSGKAGKLAWMYWRYFPTLHNVADLK
jgi:hypothetical protein